MVHYNCHLENTKYHEIVQQIYTTKLENVEKKGEISSLRVKRKQKI